jgi:hypothetical protein
MPNFAMKPEEEKSIGRCPERIIEIQRGSGCKILIEDKLLWRALRRTLNSQVIGRKDSSPVSGTISPFSNHHFIVPCITASNQKPVN